MAHLGSDEARRILIKRLEGPDPSIRFRALQDCLYVQEQSLAVHFAFALRDYRDVICLTVPEAPAAVNARVCDVAVSVMHSLGYSFSFRAEDLWRRSEPELEEARKIVAGLAAK
jgi:hypothetical protein